MTLTLLLALSASADDGCETLSDAGFRERARAAEVALDVDDIIGHAAIWKQLQRDLACLDGPVPVEPWAQFLVTLAVVEFALGQAWEEPLATALRVHPGVSRDAVPAELREWQPPGGAEGPRLPAGADWYVDGVIATMEPASGLHLVQRRLDGAWATVLLRNQPLPDAWRPAVAETPPPPPPPTPRPEAPPPPRYFLSVLAGFGAHAQRVDVPGHFLGDVAGSGPALGLATRGAAPIGPLDLAWEGAFPLSGGPGAEAWAGVGSGARLRWFVGGGASTVAVTEGGVTRTVLVPQPHAGVGLALGAPGALLLDLGAGAGATWAGWHAAGRAGLVGGAGALRWTAGLDAGWSGAALEEIDGARGAAVGRWRAGLRGGVAFGGRGAGSGG